MCTKWIKMSVSMLLPINFVCVEAISVLQSKISGSCMHATRSTIFKRLIFTLAWMKIDQKLIYYLFSSKSIVFIYAYERGAFKQNAILAHRKPKHARNHRFGTHPVHNLVKFCFRFRQNARVFLNLTWKFPRFCCIARSASVISHKFIAPTKIELNSQIYVYNCFCMLHIIKETFHFNNIQRLKSDA